MSEPYPRAKVKTKTITMHPYGSSLKNLSTNNTSARRIVPKSKLKIAWSNDNRTTARRGSAFTSGKRTQSKATRHLQKAVESVLDPIPLLPAASIRSVRPPVSISQAPPADPNPKAPPIFVSFPVSLKPNSFFPYVSTTPGKIRSFDRINSLLTLITTVYRPEPHTVSFSFLSKK